MKILNIVKPDLRDIRDQVASKLKLIRKSDPLEARRRLKRFHAGLEITEANLRHNMLHCYTVIPKESDLLGGLSDLFKQ